MPRGWCHRDGHDFEHSCGRGDSSAEDWRPKHDHDGPDDPEQAPVDDYDHLSGRLVQSRTGAEAPVGDRGRYHQGQPECSSAVRVLRPREVQAGRGPTRGRRARPPNPCRRSSRVGGRRRSPPGCDPCLCLRRAERGRLGAPYGQHDRARDGRGLFRCRVERAAPSRRAVPDDVKCRVRLPLGRRSKLPADRPDLGQSRCRARPGPAQGVGRVRLDQPTTASPGRAEGVRPALLAVAFGQPLQGAEPRRHRCVARRH